MPIAKRMYIVKCTFLAKTMVFSVRIEMLIHALPLWDYDEQQIIICNCFGRDRHFRMSNNGKSDKNRQSECANELETL